MKTRLLLLLVLFLSGMPGRSQNPETIEQLVYDWNTLHNNRGIARFKDLYAPSVLFYGRTLSGQTCYKRKAAFLKSDFSQEIISPLTLTYYSSGTIKCDFRKRTVSKGVVKEHDCYLVVQKYEDIGVYQITGESELEIDRKLKVSLQLGEIVEKPGSGSGSLSITLITAVILTGVILFYYRRRKSRENTGFEELDFPVLPIGEETLVSPGFAPVPEQVRAQVPNKVAQTPVKLPASSPQSPVLPLSELLTEQQSAKEKGDAFERYVVSRFSPDYFELLEWRSDKYHEGIYATSSRLPDLEYQFKTSYYNFRIAAECKWRAEFGNGRIEWAKNYQLITYRQYEGERRIPVFVIIGIGGEPDHPGAVYVVPLREIRSHVLTEYELKKYYRHKTGNFFLNPEAMVLE
ncbi:MAG: hypothetical protein EOO10_15500 [Chitinophagaceae bacterium]|nr:MAG: hypothetical protein EOO10_15500 [Chitinophagaceae bacterium]